MISISYCLDVLFECVRTRGLEGTCYEISFKPSCKSFVVHVGPWYSRASKSYIGEHATLMAHHDACTLPWKSSSARMCRTRRVRHSLERAKTASGANYVFLWLFWLFWFVRFWFVKDGSKMVMKLTDLGFVAMPPMTGCGFIISSWDYPSLSLSAIIWHLACLVSKRTNMSQHHS